MLARTKQFIERTLAARSPRLTAALYWHVLDPLSARLKARTDAPGTRTGGEAAALDAAIDFDVETGRWSMPALARLQLRTLGVDGIVEQRRANYLRLHGALRPNDNFRPLFAALPDGCCPLMYPLLMRDGQISLREYLVRNGIECNRFGFRHGRIPDQAFTWETALKEALVCLPVHQSLPAAAPEFIAAHINEWSSQGAR